ncbi:MAG: rhodanese-like domain-containing protein [Bacteroidota bacterium]
MKAINFNELQDWQTADRDFQLIDVREAEEHAAFNIGGTLIPLGHLLRRIEEVDRHRPVVFYCKRGIRSQIAIQRLEQKLGPQDFYNLSEGIYHLWIHRPHQT